MLKRSFAEFHAQRAAPQALEALQQGQRRLAQLRAQPWPGSPLGTGRGEVEEYHRLNMRVEELSCELQVRPWPLSSPHSPTACPVHSVVSCNPLPATCAHEEGALLRAGLCLPGSQ